MYKNFPSESLLLTFSSYLQNKLKFGFQNPYNNCMIGIDNLLVITLQ